MQPFVVHVSELKGGHNRFEWTADGKFFEGFGNQDILDADLKVEVDVVSHGVTLDVAATVSGELTVPCDRCLEDLRMPIETGFELESYVPQDDTLDLSQDVYDYACTALPLQRIHPEGGCNEETTRFINI